MFLKDKLLFALLFCPNAQFSTRFLAKVMVELSSKKIFENTLKIIKNAYVET